MEQCTHVMSMTLISLWGYLICLYQISSSLAKMKYNDNIEPLES